MDDESFWATPTKVAVTLELAPERASQVPAGRVRVRVSEGRVSQDFDVRTRRRLKSGWTRFYLETALQGH